MKKKSKQVGQAVQAEQDKPLHVRLVPKPLRSLYRRVVPRFIRVFLRERTLRFWLLSALYVLGQVLFNRIEFGVVFFIFSLVCFIFLNLDRSGSRPKNVLSAYSVFNEGNRRLAGEYDPQEYERMLRQGGNIN